VAGPPPEAASPAAAAPPEKDRAGFYSLSVELTGFDEVELLGTGAGDIYLAWLLRAFPDVMPELLEAWRAVEADYPPGEREAGLREHILGDPKLGPFTQGVLGLWYRATWVAMSADWSKAYGKHDEDVDRAFGLAYPEGLMWRAAIGSHPGGARPTGFGTWAFRPEEA
jgi:hypothetical protein